MSIFRRKPAGYGDIPGRYSRSYAATARGQLIRKNDYKKEGSPRYYFQFNPQTISDVKSTLYETRNYAGLPYVDYVWGGGGERTISFSLFMDNTPQSKTAAFIPTALGSKEAKTIKLEGATINSEGVIVTEKKTLGQQLGLSVAKGNASFQFEGDAYSLSRVSERGILDEVEYIQSHLRQLDSRLRWEDVEVEMNRLLAEESGQYSTRAAAVDQAVKNLTDGRITQTQINQWKEEYDNFAWVVAMAPAEDPKIAVAVLIFQGGTAGYAAPVAREIIGDYLNINEENTENDNINIDTAIY